MTPKRPVHLDDDPDAPPSEEESIAAESLRQALEDPRLANEAAELARAVAVAHSPRAIDATEHRRIVERTVLATPTLASPDAQPRGGGRVIRVAFGVTVSAVVAAAAAVLLLVRSNGDVASPSPAPVAAADLLPVRSTQPLFHEPFPRGGRASARIDRIAMARSGDLRENEFRRWGVR